MLKLQGRRHRGALWGLLVWGFEWLYEGWTTLQTRNCSLGYLQVQNELSSVIFYEFMETIKRSGNIWWAREIIHETGKLLMTSTKYPSLCSVTFFEIIENILSLSNFFWVHGKYTELTKDLSLRKLPWFVEPTLVRWLLVSFHPKFRSKQFFSKLRDR